MGILVCTSGKFDHRRGPVEYPPAMIEGEVIVRSDESEGNTQGRSESIRKKHTVVKPSQTSLFGSLAKINTIPKNRPIWPEEVLLQEIQQTRATFVIIRESSKRSGYKAEVANVFAEDDGNAKRRQAAGPCGWGGQVVTIIHSSVCGPSHYINSISKWPRRPLNGHHQG
jgi:hypothetical protein